MATCSKYRQLRNSYVVFLHQFLQRLQKNKIKSDNISKRRECRDNEKEYNQTQSSLYLFIIKNLKNEGMQIYALGRDKYRDYQIRNNQIRLALRKQK